MTNQDDNSSNDDLSIFYPAKFPDKTGHIVPTGGTNDTERSKIIQIILDKRIKIKIINLAFLISCFCGVTLIISITIIGINIGKSEKDNDTTKELVRTIPYQVGFLVSGIATLIGANSINKNNP